MSLMEKIAYTDLRAWPSLITQSAPPFGTAGSDTGTKQPSYLFLDWVVADI